MKLGICLPHYGRPIEVGRLLEVARRAEERGLDSVWVTDHVIVPKTANVIYREHMLDPLAVLPWLAGVTRHVALGTSVVILPYRSPIPVAKLLASVDVLAGGRLILGAAIAWLGDGWHATATNQDAFRQGVETLGRFWKDAGREGAPVLSLRIPVLVDGVHRPAVDMDLLRGRHVISGSPGRIAEELRGFEALGCSHVALEVSYSTYPVFFRVVVIFS